MTLIDNYTCGECILKKYIKLNEEKRETFRANYSAVFLFF